MDLSQIDLSLSDAGTKLELKDLDGKSFKEKAFITVKGLDSAEGRASTLKLRQKIVDAMKEETKVEEDAGIELLVDLTIGWEGIKNEGVALEFTKDNCFQIYKNYLVVREQVDKFVSNRKNFLKK
ncbi:MAG: hypothetical protein ACO29X_06475 [Arcobacteraceae bacterium]